MGIFSPARVLAPTKRANTLRAMSAVELRRRSRSPTAGRDAVVEQVTPRDRLGLDLVGIQDHPYQRRFLETNVAAGVPGRADLARAPVPDVANLPCGRPRSWPRRPRRSTS